MAEKSTNSKSRAKRTTVKKAATSSKSKSGTSNVVHPEIRKQMIEEAAYFKALNRDFQGDSCVEDWLEAEVEVDTLLNGD